MKFTMMQKVVLCGGVLSSGMLAASAGPLPPILLTIDVSNPAAVVITATGTAPQINYAVNTANDGVDLLNFFQLDEFNMTFGDGLTGTLQAHGVGAPYNDVYSDDYSTAGGATYFDMELYIGLTTTGHDAVENFSTTQPAFSGSWTIDLASLGVSASALPTPGTTGSIMSGYYGNPGQVIGDWQVTAVPEPATNGLLAAGVMALGTIVYRRRASKVS